MDETIELKISDVVFPGKGLARHEGVIVFVGNAVIGDTVRAKIVRKHKNYVEAEIVEIALPSSFRISPACPLAGTCPGCAYQHVEYDREILLKQAQLADLLKRMGGVQAPTCLPPVKSDLQEGYRNKIVLHCGVDNRQNRKLLGYIGEDNKTVLDIDNCLLAVGPINELIKHVRNDSSFMQALPSGISVVFRYTEKDGALCWTKSVHPSKTQLTEMTALGKIQVPTRSFFQVNASVANKVIISVGDIIRKHAPATVIDLYCGVGVFAMAAAEAGVPDILGIDADGRSIRTAIDNVRNRNIKNIQFVNESTERGLSPALRCIDPAGCILILDPPRRGLDKRIIETISDQPAGRLIYISCAPDILARDIARLGHAGYALESAQMFDMFPRTPYFETLAVLKHQET